MSDSASILADLAAMDAEAVDREAQLERACFEGDADAVLALMDGWADAELERYKAANDLYGTQGNGQDGAGNGGEKVVAGAEGGDAEPREQQAKAEPEVSGSIPDDDAEASTRGYIRRRVGRRVERRGWER